MFERISVIAALFVTATFLLAGCPEGGYNFNEQNVNNRPGGVEIGVGDIAVSERGYVVFESDGKLRVGWPETGEVQELPVRQPTRLDFADTRDVVYVGSDSNQTLNAVDIMDRQILWSTPLPDAGTDNMRITSSPDDSRVIVSYDDQIMLVDAREGRLVAEKRFGSGIVDTIVLSDSTRALVALDNSWDDDLPQTPIEIMNLQEGSTRRITVPNCSDKLAVTPNADYAFLAPTTCEKDPVSVIDLAHGDEHFVRNLPGFGPVGISPKGDTAVAFVDAENIDASLFEDESQIPDPEGERYHMMVIDTYSLDFSIYPFGDTLPRYAMTPNGKTMLVDKAKAYGERERLRLFNTYNGNLTTVEGPKMRLTNYVVSYDSKYAYALDENLYEIDIDRRKATEMSVGFTPRNISINANSSKLYLRRDQNRICVFDLDRRSCTSELSVEVSVDESVDES